MPLHDLSFDEMAGYRILAQGVFSPCWLDMLSGSWRIANQPDTQPGATVLVGQVIDQTALMGVLNYLYDIGLFLLSVEYLMDGRNSARAVNTGERST